MSNVYKMLPMNTMQAPIPKCEFQSLPNHQTLKHRLSALRAVNAIFVETEETFYLANISVEC